MPKVLVSDKLSETAVQIFRDRGVEVDYLPDLGKDKDKLLEVIGQYDGLAIRSATKVSDKLLAAASRLKVIGRAGIGVDEVNYGMSPGDGFHAAPYAYVGPWTPREGAFWNVPFGALRPAGLAKTQEMTYHSRTRGVGIRTWAGPPSGLRWA